MDLHQIWHCPRPELAKSYLRLLGSGLVVSTTIFAPRRTGKTVFLRQDLTPAALKAGYAVAYADLWQTRHSPGVALIRALEEALQPKTMGQRVMSRLSTPIHKLKAGGSAAGVAAELELELGDPRKTATEMALRLDELVAEAVTKKPLLLLVDEAQELARNAANELVAAALRTTITRHRDRLRVVFTGSSRSRLAHVFLDADAPLYSVGATVQDFPLLGRELPEFVAQKFETASGRRIDVAEAWAEFQAFDHRPEPFLQAIVAMLMDPTLSLEKACARERADARRRDNHAAVWGTLEALPRQLALLVLAQPDAAPFSKATLATLAAAVGTAGLGASSVQHALKVLADRNIVVKTARGQFVFDDPAFERWLRAESARAKAPPPAPASAPAPKRRVKP
jgi:hypothetical protein